VDPVLGQAHAQRDADLIFTESDHEGLDIFA
jgi:hypothetical protein